MVTEMVLFMSLLSIGFAQRPSYAGRIPYGYPELDQTSAQTTTRTTTTTTAALSDDLFVRDKFDFEERTTPTRPPVARRLPIEANGDAAFVDRLQRLPADRQPFWLLNWQALDQLRNVPHSYYVNHNQFIDYSGNRWI